MGLMIIHHGVSDYGSWRPVYDGHESKRVEAGLTKGRVFRGTADPNDLVILLDMADVDKAKAFAASEDLKAAMQRAGVLGPPTIHYLP